MKCDEMKAYTYDDMLDGNADVDIEYYPKSEADKVIADKDAEIARLNAICKVHIEAIESMGAGLLQNDEEIRHQKYKRCVAMAEWCDAEADVADADGDYEDMRRYQKWHRRWLAIAEQFKEAK